MSIGQGDKTLSVVVPVYERAEDAAQLFVEYYQHLTKVVDNVEFIYIIGERYQSVAKEMETLSREKSYKLKLIILSRDFGEATAVKAGVDQATGDYILTLPPYKQVETEELDKLIDGIGDYDLAIGKRWPRLDSQKNRFQTRLFNSILYRLSGQKYTDIGCGARLIKRDVLAEVRMYGDQLRFLPLLAFQLGYHSVEVELKQAPEESRDRIYRPGVYLRRFLDLLTIIFLTKFNKKPLRFFGLIGAGSISLGILGLIYLAFERLVFGVEVSDRPMLVMFSLFFVLGAQLISIGLIGETIIFTHSKEMKEYQIKEIINQ